MNVDFPLHFDGRGRTAEADSDAHIKDMIEQVLFTAPGERVNRPTFGSGVQQLVFAPKRRKLAPAAERHVSLISRIHLPAEGYHLVPECAQHCHTVAVIPHRGPDHTAGSRHADHLGQRFRGLGDEVERQEGERAIELSVAESKLLSVTDFNADTIPQTARLRERHVRRGSVNANDAAGSGGRDDGRSQRAGARPDVEDGVAVANAGKPDQARREFAAPPAHEALVRVAG